MFFGEIKFGVGDLPGEEVGGPKLPAGADEKVNIGLASRIEKPLKNFFGNLFYGDFSLDDAFDSAKDLVSAAIV